MAWPRHPPDPSTLATPACSRAAPEDVLNMVGACLMALTDPWAPHRAVQTRFSLPHAAASLRHPSPSPTPRRKPQTKEIRNKIQERGSGRRGPVSDQPDPQEEIIETRLRHVPGDGMCRGDRSLPALSGRCGQGPAARLPEPTCSVLPAEMAREGRHQKMAFW